eukprot:TRINITY_DN6732_c0_g3_i1.p1 TRINITY_DN6732_c0_g3~~TRINITY_DN6732_c0_g3_i1.p1  ORF type:complete len:439 (+),score=93.26 TRINITY_DN6732_c0_g3_i1:71-1318(+)
MREGLRVIVLSDGVSGAFQQSMGLLSRLTPRVWKASIVQCAPQSMLRFVSAAVHVFWIRFCCKVIMKGNRRKESNGSISSLHCWKFLGLQSPTVNHGLISSKQSLGVCLDETLIYDDAWPDLVIASGRLTAPANVAIKLLSGGKTKIVQIQHPRVNPKHFDLVITPQHDRHSIFDGIITSHSCIARFMERVGFGHSTKVVYTHGSLHRLTPSRIDEERQLWTRFLQDLSQNRPCISLLVGGMNKNYSPDMKQLHQLLGQIMERVEREDLFLLVTYSRRTDSQIKETIERVLQPYHQRHWIWDGKDDNPYLGFLACSHAIFVTADSVNMVCEAASTKLPVYVIYPSCCKSRKFKAFHRNLLEKGFTKDANVFAQGLSSKESAIQTQPAWMDDTGEAARQVLQLFPQFQENRELLDS